MRESVTVAGALEIGGLRGLQACVANGCLPSVICVMFCIPMLLMIAAGGADCNVLWWKTREGCFGAAGLQVAEVGNRRIQILGCRGIGRSTASCRCQGRSQTGSKEANVTRLHECCHPPGRTPSVSLFPKPHLLRVLTQAQVGRFTNGPIRAGI